MRDRKNRPVRIGGLNGIAARVLADREFMAGAMRGFEQAERGETIALSELDDMLADWEVKGRKRMDQESRS